MNALSYEIQDVIAKNLPAATAGELRKYLDLAVKQEGELQAVRLRESGLERKSAVLEADLTIAKKEIADLQAREKRSLDLDARERGFELECARLKLAAAEDKTKSIVGLAEIAFRNPRLVHSLTENAQVQRPVGNPPYQTQMPEFKSIFGTTEETK